MIRPVSVPPDDELSLVPLLGSANATDLSWPDAGGFFTVTEQVLTG